MHFRYKVSAFLGIFLISVSSGMACQTSVSTPDSGAKKKGKVDITVVSPKDGSTVRSTDLLVEVKVTGVEIVAPGSPIKSGEGHIHYRLDGGGLIHSDRITQSYSGVGPGEHTLTVELVQNNHNSRRPPLKKTIMFNVADQGRSVQ